MDLQDIHPIYKTYGTTEIWYYCQSSMKLDFYLNPEKYITIDDLTKTHILLAKINDRNLDSIFSCMQSEIYPEVVDTKPLFASKKITHTSMSIGDVIKIDTEYFVCSHFGWKKLN
jgi:hypothetical protein